MNLSWSSAYIDAFYHFISLQIILLWYIFLFVKKKYILLFRVVVRLGSTVPFSQELNELQEEVKPLWKMPSCHRDFKRTSVEILFREAEFRLDWCSFRLVSYVRNFMLWLILHERNLFLIYSTWIFIAYFSVCNVHSLHYLSSTKLIYIHTQT